MAQQAQLHGTSPRDFPLPSLLVLAIPRRARAHEGPKTSQAARLLRNIFAKMVRPVLANPVLQLHVSQTLSAVFGPNGPCSQKGSASELQLARHGTCPTCRTGPTHLGALPFVVSYCFFVQSRFWTTKIVANV